MTTVGADAATALAARLRTVLAGPPGARVRIEDLRRLTGGASRTTWAFTAHTEAGSRALILRTGPPDDVHAGMELEARVQELAAAQDAPVPEVLAASNSTVALGNPYLICSEIGGETIVRRILRGLDGAGRARLLMQCAAALAAIHRADPADAELVAEDPLTLWRTSWTRWATPPRHLSGRSAGWRPIAPPIRQSRWCTATSGWAT